MNNSTCNPYPDISKSDTPVKWQEPFNDLLDEIYFPGYAKQLLEEDAQAYSREYFYFLQLYD